MTERVYRKWTDAETEQLLELGAVSSDAEIAIRLNRDVNSIRNKRKLLRKRGIPGTFKTASNRPPASDPTDYLEVRQVAQLSGASKTQIYRASKDGRLPSQVVNGQRFWRTDEVIKWRDTVLQEPAQAWRDDEIEALLELAGTCSHQQIAAYLGNGRTARAVHHKTIEIGISTKGHGGRYTPFAVRSSAILIAKTCPLCGKFLDAAYFVPSRTNGARYRDKCAPCFNEKYNKSDDPAVQSEIDKARSEKMRNRREPLQNITLAAATNHGQEWTSTELEALSNTEKPDVALALELGRTYLAVVAKRNQLGIHRRPPPLNKRNIINWAISFPKAHEAIEQWFQKLGEPVPEELWEWNDTEEMAS